ncbi:hypothetical protein [Pseudomonas sp.]|uniref:hypothetical protein n=1 Tax=Pseudomonas sp. TaxID=306 RepID=UPI00260AA4FB|nr:hypothetical protein [Pseudomonas sp.]
MLELLNALVLDDAFAPPGAGAVTGEDKNDWIDFVANDAQAQAVLLAAFSAMKAVNIDALLEELISDHKHIATLWDHHESNTLADANLVLLFKTYSLNRMGKLEKPLAVCEALQSFVKKERLRTVWQIEDIVGETDQVDVAFIDFFLDDNEQETAALQRIRNYKEHLTKVKLLFFMSSRASIEVQQSVRSILGKRTAFFEVMTKTDVNAEFVLARIRERRATYLGNKSLEDIVLGLADATRTAAEEFWQQCDDLEVHDLRLLNLARLAAEGESVSAYLTWLASESIASKIRRIYSEKPPKTLLDSGKISISGQAKQSKVLFELFSDVVFGPSQAAGSHLQFGEILVPKVQRNRASKALELRRKASTHAKSKVMGRNRLWENLRETAEYDKSITPHWHAPDRYLLILTPACDLVRCSPSKSVLCVVGVGEDLDSLKDQVSDKLYGKHKQGLRHLLNAKGPGSPVLITWQKDQTFMLSVRELLSGTYRRVAQMNELYAHEVKEEVLRQLGRVGTQIDPPPPFALHAQLRWKASNNSATMTVANTQKDSFYSAVLSYAEQDDDKFPVVILSDEFRQWATNSIHASLNGQPAHTKLKKCLDLLENTSLFTLKKNLAHKGDLQVRLIDEGTDNEGSFVVDIALSL